MKHVESNLCKINKTKFNVQASQREISIQNQMTGGRNRPWIYYNVMWWQEKKEKLFITGIIY